jgi:hypothetical protein
MAYSNHTKRFRGDKKRLAQIRLTVQEKRFAALVVLICLWSIAAGVWLGANYHDQASATAAKS